jgi:hypothetical protein
VPSTDLRDAVLSALARRGGAVPGLLRLDSGAVAVEVSYEEPTLLIAERSGAEAFDLALLQHAATAVEVSHASLREDHRRQIGASLLAQLRLIPNTRDDFVPATSWTARYRSGVVSVVAEGIAKHRYTWDDYALYSSLS